MKLYNTKDQHMCAYMHHIHIHAPPNTHVHHQTPPKYKIYLLGLPSVLYERPGSKWEICVESVDFVAFRVLFHEKCNAFQWKVQLFSWKAPLFSEKREKRGKRRFSYERPFARNCNHMFSILCLEGKFFSNGLGLRSVEYFSDTGDCLGSGVFYNIVISCLLQARLQPLQAQIY